MIPENSEEMRFYDVFPIHRNLQTIDIGKDTQNKRHPCHTRIGKPLEDNPEKIASLSRDELTELKKK